jgi:hypothetical protein
MMNSIFLIVGVLLGQGSGATGSKVLGDLSTIPVTVSVSDIHLQHINFLQLGLEVLPSLMILTNSHQFEHAP